MSDITIKTAEEIKLLRQGGKILASILDELEKEAVPGATTQDIDDRAMELIEEYGVEPMTLGYQPQFAPFPYPAATCISVNDELVHGIPSEDVELVEGDIVSIDVVIAYEGMVVDSSRTVAVGEVSKEARALMHATRQALEAGIKAAQPGARVGDIGAAVEDAVPKGYGVVETFCGHGVGYDLHEAPEVPNFRVTGETATLEPGMVLAIEPMLTFGSKEVEVLDDGYTAATVDGSLSAHFEHTVVITENGPEVLTRGKYG